MHSIPAPSYADRQRIIALGESLPEPRKRNDRAVKEEVPTLAPALSDDEEDGLEWLYELCARLERFNVDGSIVMQRKDLFAEIINVIFATLFLFSLFPSRKCRYFWIFLTLKPDFDCKDFMFFFAQNKRKFGCACKLRFSYAGAVTLSIPVQIVSSSKSDDEIQMALFDLVGADAFDDIIAIMQRRPRLCQLVPDLAGAAPITAPHSMVTLA
jgi:hypothetical protein